MPRIVLLCLASALVLTGCSSEKQDYYAGAPIAEVAAHRMPAETGTAGQAFAYNHSIQVTMGNDRVEARFARARDRCLKDATLGCTLLSASINVRDGRNAYDGSRAQLDVMLPGEQVETFEKSVTELLPDEQQDNVKVDARSTAAQNVTQEAADLDQQIQQLTDYRDRLAELAKRPNLAAADLIQVSGELSKTQTSLDQLLAQKRDVGERVSKQKMTVYLGGRLEPDPFRPIGRVLKDSIEIFMDSVADALRFAIQVIPWLPIVATGLLLVSWLWRRFRRPKVST